MSVTIPEGEPLTIIAGDYRKQIPWNKEKKCPQLSGKNNGMYGIHCRGESSGMFGKHHSEKTKRIMSGKHWGRKPSILGKKFSEESKRKMSKAQMGDKNHFWGKRHSEKTKQRIGEAQKGEKGNAWKGGISFEPYTMDWTQTLKRSIRERDRYTCQLCGALQKDKVFCVHHIDYDKKNCNPKNLITLCRGCNTKVNNKRNFWVEYFS